MARTEVMARLGYGQAWLDAGVLDEALLEAQALEPEPRNPEHLRWAMWLAFAGRELRREVPSSLLEKLLALDIEESRAPSPNFDHSIAFYPPMEIVRALECRSPLEAILELSSAWCAPVADLTAAGALVANTGDAGEADAALKAVCHARAPQWSLAVRVAGARKRCR